MSSIEHVSGWPEIRREMRPWAYNWWLGSAVDGENLDREYRRCREGGLGGLHIVPIYGAKGAEDRFIPHLSNQWMRMLAFAIAAAGRQDLGIDLTTGNTTVNGGTVVWSNAVLSAGADLLCTNSPTIGLSYDVTNTIRRLYINNKAQAVGVYKTGNAPAGMTITGNGALEVTDTVAPKGTVLIVN